jgi:lipopolysaccharide transport system ATP-binding protein
MARGDQHILTVTDLGIRYKDYTQRDGWVLSNLNFELQHGETLGVIGRNGAGKSSLLSVLAGITLPDAGRVVRQPKTRASLLTINVGFMPDLPARENIFVIGMLLGLSHREITNRHDEIMAFADLEIDPKQKLGTFSSGMRARLALAIALAAAPEIILIDEMLGVGDGEFRTKSSQAIHDVIKADRSVVLVAHDLTTVQKLCDRVMWIEEGTIRSIGETESVLEAYNTFLNNKLA